MQACSCPAAPLRVATALMLVVALATTVLVTATEASAQVDAGAETALVNLVDQSRGAVGALPLRVCSDLRDVARSWSTRMADEGQLSHGPIAAQVRGWRGLGETVGVASTAHAVHRRFLASPGHRAHMLSTRYTEVGIGAKRRAGVLWVTQIFREPDGSAPCAIVPLDARIITACPPGLVPTTTFDDVRGNTHREAVACVVWYGLANGTSTATYGTGDPLNRAQMAALLIRLVQRSGLRLPAPHDQGFTDIAGNHHADAINQLAQLSVVRGLSDTVYGPSGLVSRAQMATFLVRAYAAITGETLPVGPDRFTDDDGLVHEEAINRAAEAGIIVGISSTIYEPHRAVQRDQAASMFARMLNRLVRRGHLSPPA